MTPPERPAAADVGVAPVLTALRAAASGSRLEATLHAIVHAAVRYVDASSGALGVLAADGRRLERLVVVDPGGADREGRTPPAQTSLDLPVRVGDAVLGNLHLGEKRGGSVTPADIEVAQALAAVAGLVIENARLAERADARRTWDRAATDMATALLSGADPDAVLRTAAERVSSLTGADITGVLAPSIDDDRTMTIVTAVGEGAADVEGVRVPLSEPYVDATVAGGRPRLIDDISTMPVVGVRAEVVVELTAGAGPAMIVPLGNGAERGLLVTLRAAGRDPFCAEDLDLLSAFSAQASVALELARAQRRERRLQVEIDRDRIARDLHDHVVQRIFATGLALDRIGRSVKEHDPALAERIAQRVDELDGTIARIRSAIFELRDVDDDSPVAVRRRLGQVVRSVTEGEALRPDLRLRNGVEDLPPALVHDVVAVVRELLTNVVRHAGATRVTVLVAAATDVSVVVTDDGHGLPPVTVRSGLANLADRAERRHGSLSLVSGPTGTEVAWTVPMPGRG